MFFDQIVKKNVFLDVIYGIQNLLEGPVTPIDSLKVKAVYMIPIFYFILFIFFFFQTSLGSYFALKHLPPSK